VGGVTPRECTEWQGIMAMDAVGETTADESRGLAEHLEHCDQCASDAVDVRSAARALAFLDRSQLDSLTGGVDSVDPSVVGGRVAGPEPASLDEARARALRGRRGRAAAVVGAVAAVAAAVLAVVALSAGSGAPTRTVALTGQRGVVASVSLTTQSWGTRATLRETGQAAGQVLTVSMKSSSGRWWVAGSYRTTGRPGTVEVQLSCAVQADQITAVWVSDQAGNTVLDGYLN